MSVLVAIESCWKNKQRRDWQRQSWLSELKLDYKFFIGEYDPKADVRQDSLEPDVVILPCKDDYKSLPEKTLEVVRWARESGHLNGHGPYDWLLKLDDDVYCRPERLVIPETDYVGHAYGHKHYCSGAAYWLSTRSMDAILNHWCRRTNAEDMCVGETLKRQGITLTEDPRYKIGWKSLKKDEGENEFPNPENDTITFHHYWPEFMPEMHRSWTKKQLVDLTHFNSLRNR